MSFPNTYKVLKTRIIESSYSILENIYRANIFQEVDHKKRSCCKYSNVEFLFGRSFKKRFN